ncbi:MAG: transcription antitermination factor NusB [Clostridia bacterium]|nr:transcription antitermination factor NusB [Clostridia bacterium]
MMKNILRIFFLGISNNRSTIDEKIKSHLKDWDFNRINKIDLAILRLAIYEICFVDDIPCKVSVNEAVELSKAFGEDSSSSFVNGILAEIIKENK